METAIINIPRYFHTLELSLIFLAIFTRLTAAASDA